MVKTLSHRPGSPTTACRDVAYPCRTNEVRDGFHLGPTVPKRRITKNLEVRSHLGQCPARSRAVRTGSAGVHTVCQASRRRCRDSLGESEQVRGRGDRDGSWPVLTAPGADCQPRAEQNGPRLDLRVYERGGVDHPTLPSPVVTEEPAEAAGLIQGSGSEALAVSGHSKRREVRAPGAHRQTLRDGTERPTRLRRVPGLSTDQIDPTVLTDKAGVAPLQVEGISQQLTDGRFTSRFQVDFIVADLKVLAEEAHARERRLRPAQLPLRDLVQGHPKRVGKVRAGLPPLLPQLPNRSKHQHSPPTRQRCSPRVVLSAYRSVGAFAADSGQMLTWTCG